MTAMEPLTADERTHSLRGQHRDWQREGYDGHNRHSGLTPMSTLRGRRLRRRARRTLAWLALAWDPARATMSGPRLSSSPRAV
ncbi:MAG TPA: hypothetical protein VKV26_09225 [Dehalococcoidia bacterium]|nr:hypothetical protein [Dehalococcoidia bacterium]